MDEESFDKFIKNKQYKDSSQFNENPKSLMRLVNYVKTLPLSLESFSTLYALLKFYRTPLFIACLPLYEKVQKNKSECNKQMMESIQQIATFVKGYLDGYNLEQLNFFYVFGTLKKKKKLGEKSQTEIVFIKYIENLGMHIRRLNKQLNDINPEQIKLEVDSILAGGLERKLNPLEFYYEQYFKNEADKIYKQHIEKISQFEETHLQKGIQLRPYPEEEKKVPLCCRTYFYDQEPIKEPENLVIQYKNYRFPFVDHHLKILKKTICGFLNTDGGTIFLGIHQDVNTKIRHVVGMQLNSADREQIMFTLRKDVLELVDPDIISNKSYSVVFVPVKQIKKPHRYITGRCIVKIIIKYGIRNQIYSYKHEGYDYFAFRTQNQVIHRDGRDVLNAYRQRLKNPLPIPIPAHEGACKQPEQGQVERMQRRQVFERNLQRNAQRNLQRNIQRNVQRNAQRNVQRNAQRKSKAFKQKDAVDFVIQKISQKELLKQLNLRKLDIFSQTSSDSKKKICFLKIKQKEKKNEFIQFLSMIQYEKKGVFYESQRGIVLADNRDIIFAKSQLESCQFSFSINDKQKNIILEFRSTEEAISAFLLLKDVREKMQIAFFPV